MQPLHVAFEWQYLTCFRTNHTKVCFLDRLLRQKPELLPCQDRQEKNTATGSPKDRLYTWMGREDASVRNHLSLNRTQTRSTNIYGGTYKADLLCILCKLQSSTLPCSDIHQRQHIQSQALLCASLQHNMVELFNMDSLCLLELCLAVCKP